MRKNLPMGALAALAACGVASAATKPAPKVWDVPARHLAGGAQGDVGYQIFYTEQAWKRAADQHRWSGNPPAALPKVDWAKDMVITATDGTRPTAGYGLNITAVQRVGSDIVVRVRETRPAADAILAQVVTYPSDAVAVRRMDGPVQFVITKDAAPAPGLPASQGSQAPTPPDTPPVADTLAKSVFTIRQRGGIAGADTATVIHLYGRPLQASERPSGVRDVKDVQIAGPKLRTLEETVRSSGFLDLQDHYAPATPHADQMTRVISVNMPGAAKSVAMEDGAQNVPAAFETVWAAIQEAIQP